MTITLSRFRSSPIARFVPCLCGTFFAALLPLAARADVQPDAIMLRNPAISDSRIAFVYANQVWTAPRTGGVATPIAAPYGRAAFPRFSPDGKTIAFCGNYDGNRDIYSVPLSGGVPTRVTHHPAGETLCNWTADGKLLFFAGGVKGDHWTSKLFTVSPSGGLPEQLPVPYATFGAISPDGQWLVYTPWSRDNATWKRYMGGTAANIWLYNLKTNQSKRLTEWDGTDLQPMWGYNRASKTVYYLSDAGPEHRLNIWACDTGPDRPQCEQITKFTDDDVKWPSIGPGSSDERGKGEIVFQLGSQLMVLNLDTKEAKPVRITIPGARPVLRAQVKDAAPRISNAWISPSGKRALFTARGEVFSVPVKEGVARNLTNTTTVHERNATWSPDGRWIAYFSDKSGEYELYLQASDARAPEDDKDKDDDDEAKDETGKDDKPKGEEKKNGKPPLREPVKLTNLGPGFRFAPWWLPDSKHILFGDNAGNLMLATLNFESDTPTAQVKTIDTDPWSQAPALSCSHDSGWIAYVRNDEGTGNGCVWLYNVNSGEKTRVTSPMFGATDVAFDRKGDYLYFRQRCDLTRPTYGDSDGAFVYAGTERFLLTPLRKDVKDPLAPKSEEESLKEEAKEDEKKSDEKKSDDKKDDAGDKKTDDAKDAANKDADKKDEKKPDKKNDKKPVKIDLDGFEQRAVRLPIDAGNFGNTMVADGGKLLYVRYGARGTEAKPAVKIFDVSADEKEEKEVAAECSQYVLSEDGKKILANVSNKWKVMDAAPDGGGKDKKKDVPTDGLKVRIEPREEWKNIFNDAWRIMRDYFYVQNMHGVDWNKVRDHYGKMIADCANREDVNYVIGEMISELNVGHAYLWSPGDVEDAPTTPVGLLGCDFELTDANGARAYRISEIYHGAPWDSDARGPIAAATPAKNRPKVGDYLLAVNGRPVDTREDPWAAFVGLADKPTMITVSDKPTLDDTARECLVKPVSGDRNLRYRAWVERKRAYVAEKTGGKVAYIHVPNTGIEGQNELFRQFFGQVDRPALIIDERWNGGGQIPWRFIELLNRPRTNFWAVRHGRDWPQPSESHQGPKCMLINEQAGSGGDMFPWLFRHHKLGKLIGTRTWGGLVGISGNPELIDGGSITAPTFGFYKLDSTWAVEGYGVDPDMTVVDDPALMANGGDPQLDAGIRLMLDEIERNPPPVTQRPPPPDRTGMGIPEKDR